MNQATDYSLLDASGGTLPPALPIKQRRSKSSSSSIQDLELKAEDLHLSGPQTPISPFTEVFTPSHCNAAHCPIHNRYENHQARFFSDDIPPPVPKKNLTRTFSLPTETPDQPQTYNYENPLYMITPFHGSHTVQEEELQEEVHQGLSLQKMTFDTPDEQLQKVLRSFQSQEQVSTGIQKCSLQFLRNMLQKTEASIFPSKQEIEMAKTSSPHDFILSGQKWNAFWLARCLKVPGRMFAAKVHRGGSVTSGKMSMPHPNIEQGMIHFPQRTATEHASTLDPLHEEATEVRPQQTVADLLEEGVRVTIVRDFPSGTLEDFVEEGHSLHSILPEVYEKRLCLLALQLVQGLQHLRHFKIFLRELKPQSVTLVWPSIARKDADAWEYPNETKREIGTNTDTSTGFTESKEPKEKEMRKSEICHTLWKKWGTPRLVLKSHNEDDDFLAAPSHEFQLGTLLRYSLHVTDNSSLECKVQETPYTAGLLWLVTQLASEKPGLQLAHVEGVLQVLLWGPRQVLFQQNQLENSAFHNWLLLKQFFLVFKLAEKGLLQDHDGFDWEDYLCLHYLSLSNLETLHSITEHMGLDS